MVTAILVAAWSALCILAGYLTHRHRTRRTVAQLDAQIGELIASLTAISPDAAEYRAQVVADNERRLHATRARLDAYHLLGEAA